MNKRPDLSTTNIAAIAIKNITQYFSWLVLILSIFVLIFVSIVNSFGLDFSVSSFTLYAVISSVCSLMVYFSFQKNGTLKGKENESYLNNYTSYKKAINGRQREEITKYLNYAKDQEKNEYIYEVSSIVGLSESEMRTLTKADLKQGDFTHRQRKHIKNILNNDYPNTSPKSPAVVLNVLAINPQSSHGVDVNAKRRYLIQQGVTKGIITIMLMTLGASLAIEAGSVSWLQTILKLLFTVIALIFSLYNGYNSGYKSTSEIEKDILGAMIRFLSDMDIWSASQINPNHKQLDVTVSTEPLVASKPLS